MHSTTRTKSHRNLVVNSLKNCLSDESELIGKAKLNTCRAACRQRRTQDPLQILRKMTIDGRLALLGSVQHHNGGSD